MQIYLPNTKFITSMSEHIFKAPRPGTLVDEYKGVSIYAHDTVYKVRLNGTWHEFKNRALAKRAINRSSKRKN